MTSSFLMTWTAAALVFINFAFQTATNARVSVVEREKEGTTVATEATEAAAARTTSNEFSRRSRGWVGRRCGGDRDWVSSRSGQDTDANLLDPRHEHGRSCYPCCPYRGNPGVVQGHCTTHDIPQHPQHNGIHLVFLLEKSLWRTKRMGPDQRIGRHDRCTSLFHRIYPREPCQGMYEFCYSNCQPKKTLVDILPTDIIFLFPIFLYFFS